MLNQFILHADQSVTVINRHIYGHFAEHLGRCIYGGLYVGEDNKKIPHTNGVRNDIIAALKNLQIPNLRWPGGCFADTYHWKDGIGPKPSRPGIVNTWWGDVTEDNFFGTHDFLNLCEALDAEPYIAANAGSGTVQELMDWVQYANFEGVSPMSSLRQSNGRSKPWKVKFWGIGNEAWGCGGNMTASYYANIYRQYATFMTGWSNTANLFRIASGANSADYQWTETLMRDIPHSLLEGIALHHYAVADWHNRGPSSDFSEEQYLTNIKAALRIDEIIAKHSAVMDRYDPSGKIALVVDEWGTWYNPDPGTNPGFLHQQNTMRDAVIAAATLNIFNRHAARVRMANLAQTVNVLQAVIHTHDDKMWLTPTYHVMNMFKVHQGSTLVPLGVISSDTLPGDEEFPSIISSASRDKNGFINLTMVNAHPTHTQQIRVDLKGLAFTSIEATLLTSSAMTDHNTFEHRDRVTPIPWNDVLRNDGAIQFALPAFSICLITLAKD
jgi:alpha-L-arabinofuranosidase